jgi:membrane carboxypeptidase/penicillin-binding protein
VGGRSPGSGSFNRAYQARRQTGSAIKPIVYAAAFASGRGLTAASTVSDEPVTFPTDRGPWAPHNDDGTYHSQVTLVKALERSINVATTNLVMLIGPAEVARVAARFGLVNLKPVMSIGLGSNEATLLDLTRAFAVFGDGGWLVPPSSLRAVTDRSGHLMLDRPSGAPVEPGTAGIPAGARRALPAPIAALMTGMLTDVVRFGVAYPLRSQFGFLRPAAGKTGTTDDYRDGWFVGFTPDIVAGVWVGYDRPRSMGRLAATTALPTWARVVPPLLDGFPERPFASDPQLEWRNIEPWSGLLGTPLCSSQPAPFLPGTAPRAYCVPSLPLGPEPLDSLGVQQDSTGTQEP